MEAEIKVRSYRNMAILSLVTFFIATSFFFFLKEYSDGLSSIEEEKESIPFDSNYDCSEYFTEDCFQKISQKIKDRLYSIGK